MRDFIYAEMMVHVPLCTSKEAKDILIISDKPQKLSAEASRHSESRVTVISCNLNEVSSLNDSVYDVIVSEMPSERAFFA